MEARESTKRNVPNFFKPIRKLLAPPPITVRDGEVNEATSGFEVENAGVAEHLYFRSLSGDGLLQANADVPLLLTLLQAMKRRRSIKVEGRVTPTLLGNLHQYMDAFSRLHPRFKPVKIIADEAPQLECSTRDRAGNSQRVGAFFSGGVDSFYTLFMHRDEITDLVFIHGFDVGLDDQRLRDQASLMGKNISEATGLRFIEIETNARQVQKRWGRWGPHAHGLGLTSVGRSLAGYLSKLYIPGSFSEREQLPWGTHPDLDFLLGDEAIQFVHDQNNAERTDKIEYISQFPVALEVLRVCYKNPDGAYNCCECEKCLRTMTTLHALGVLHKAATFPQPLTAAAITALKPPSKAVKVLVRDNLQLLEKADLKGSDVYAAWAKKMA